MISRVGCVVVAAGRGTRAGLPYNKLFYALDGRSVLTRCLDALASTGLIDELVLVLASGDMPEYERRAHAAVSRAVCGGDTRQQSVKNGLDALSKDIDIVLIHDGARPFVSREMIECVIRDVEQYGSGVLSTPMTDTIKQTDGEMRAVNTLDRARLRAVQTPQGFLYARIIEAHGAALREGYTATDDAALYERRFNSVKLTDAPGARDNIKLTSPEDFRLAERLLCAPRTGIGYDAHKLVGGRKLILCGVEIPYEKGLLGHSDADVALHALIDAMLGACALGDIGKLFPDTDERYKGISSITLLELTRAEIARAGYRASNADITIICQKPKLATYIERMRVNVAEALGISERSVSVKATTTEGMGFEGEGLGISAQAVATLIRQ